MYFIYSVVLGFGFALALPWFLWKGRATGKYFRTFRERMGRLPVYLNIDGDRSIWVHAVSVGEVLATRPGQIRFVERCSSAGDGIMVLFGAPIAHEDDPRRGVHAQQ